MIKKSRLLFVAGLMCWSCIMHAQGVPASTAVRQVMETMYRNYDSIKYLSFDVKFNYGSDTLLGKYDNEQMDGSFTLAGKRAKYRLGDIDFMQNDSFFIAIYNRDKLIMVDEPKMNNVGSQLPMRQQMDSLLLSYANQYTITLYMQGTDTGVIQLVRADSLAQFDKFSISYDDRTKMLYKVTYEYTEPAQLDSAVLAAMELDPTAGLPVQKKKLSIQFLNYRFDNYDDTVYDENNYIWFENDVCKPVEKYEGYKIYNAKPVLIYNTEPQ